MLKCPSALFEYDYIEKWLKFGAKLSIPFLATFYTPLRQIFGLKMSEASLLVNHQIKNYKFHVNCPQNS